MLNKIVLLNKKECKIIENFILENEEKIKSLGPDIYEGTENDSLTGRFKVYNFMYDLPGKIIIPKLKNLFKLKKIKLPISIQSWANIFRKNEGIKKHKHSNDTDNRFICANLFISGDENIGTNFIVDNKDINYKNNVGEMMFFLSDLEHYVNKNTKNDVRITMAFDIYPNIEMQNTTRYYILK
jgi:hypothetical protein